MNIVLRAGVATILSSVVFFFTRSYVESAMMEISSWNVILLATGGFVCTFLLLMICAFIPYMLLLFVSIGRRYAMIELYENLSQQLIYASVLAFTFKPREIFWIAPMIAGAMVINQIKKQSQSK